MDEVASARQAVCLEVGRALRLSVAGAASSLRLVEAGLTFPLGNLGVSTMRLVCAFEAPLAAPIEGHAVITFSDEFEAARIGFREVVVSGSGVAVDAPGVPSTSPSARLTTYPTGLAAAPDVQSMTFAVEPGGPVLAAFSVPDADPIGPLDVATGAVVPATPSTGSSSRVPSSGSTGVAPAGPSSPGTASVAAIPGGEGAIPDVLRIAPATPLLALIAVVTAAGLGAGHALTPGHGKTLMAAYLVGTRGTLRHAVGLGMAVSVSHTLGILGLAVLVLAAESSLPPDLVVRTAPLVAAVSILAIGGWMLLTELRRAAAARRIARRSGGGHVHDHADEHHHHEHENERDQVHAHHAARGDDHDHAHEPGHEYADDGLEHSHGGVRHRHLPPAGSTISWRSLFVLGLAGGLVPSASALVILLATIAAGRPAWGIVLVAAFGLGMAAVMTGVGLAFVHARGLLDRAPTRLRATRAIGLVPAGAGVVVLALGLVLTTQALAVAGLA
jgi:ABC-type nickel/cobalt efflux system permease component RcnA